MVVVNAGDGDVMVRVSEKVKAKIGTSEDWPVLTAWQDPKSGDDA